MQGIRVQTRIHDSHRKLRIEAGNQDSSRDSGIVRNTDTQASYWTLGVVPDSGLVSVIQSKIKESSL